MHSRSFNGVPLLPICGSRRASANAAKAASPPIQRLLSDSRSGRGDGCRGALRLFSVNRFNVFSFHERDHGDVEFAAVRAGSSETARRGTRRSRRNCPHDDAAHARLRLQSVERLFLLSQGWSAGRDFLRGEQHFGQRHTYVIPAVADADGLVRQESTKSLYVSPFLDTNMSYAFERRRQRNVSRSR